MGRVVQYLFPFPSGDLQLRHWHSQMDGRVTRFVVQLELFWQNEWRAIVRYDTAHGVAHRDLIHPTGRVDKMPMGLEDWNQALTTALEDLKANWPWYRERFLKEGGKDE